MRPLATVLVLLVFAAGCTARSGSSGSGPSGSPGGSVAPAAPNVPGWRALAPAPSRRTEVVAAAAGSRVYVIGGFRADGGTVATVEIFDAITGRWERGPDLPVPVNHAMATTANGAVHVFGGYRADGSPGPAAFRWENGGWRAIAPMPQPRAAGTAAVAAGLVYVAGGIGANGLAKEMLVYDPGADRWTTAPGPPTPREHLGGAGFGGRVYTVGGRKGGLDTNLAAFEAYDPSTGQWTRLPDLPTRRGGLSATATCNGQVVAVGGEAAATFAEAEAFDVTTGRWSRLPPLPTPRHGLGVVALGTTVYTFAGGPRPGLYVADSTEAVDLAALGACPSASAS